MPGPWGAITAILTRAPLLIGAADALLARARHKQSAAGDIETLRQRIAILEQHQQANAELSQQLAEHASAITTATQAGAAKARQAFVLAIVAATLGVVAVLLAWLR